ncbi:MAG TPA: hypothetical protein VJU15_06770, partial [Gemmatimonadales bacterium]|nr:hypothetical protein [Gemmatimonadales bacterium]
MNEAGSPQAGMGVAPEGQGAVYVNSKAGKIAAQMNGTPGIAVWNAEGRNVAVMNATSAGKGRFSIWDGDTRVAMLEDSAGSGTLTLMKGAGGQVIARLGMVSGAGRHWPHDVPSFKLEDVGRSGEKLKEAGHVADR